MSTSVFTINDIKDALEENKWSSGVTWDLNETTNYEVFDYSTIASNHINALQSASKVIDSKVLDANDTVLMNWNTALFTNNNNSHMYSIFNRSQNLTEWNSDLSSLTNGDSMFSYCTNLESFNSDLSSLTIGGWMFKFCSALESFNGDLSSLTIGEGMFAYCTALASFDSNLSNLTNGDRLFWNCIALESFNGDLSSLINGYCMFSGTALKSFNSDLSSLTDGSSMFFDCKLDTASVKNIASTINDLSDDTDDGNYGWGKIVIGIGNTTPNTEEETAFNTIASKGWTVYVNGDSSSNIWTPTAFTNLTDEEQSTPIPFYAKPIQTTEERASYVDQNNNYYNIVGAQFIYGDDISTYGQFTSFEHAVSEITLALGLTKYTKPTEEKESEEEKQ